ncbi:sacsin N-terminal ATP-binding-like domain-containing protein [Nocardioides kribbensis]|uniref:Sacsin/Nov domain-containing protein n=1 Tax=Nocardioides kribbensis TaxID=305517 RepID=A0ABV1NTK0_9ACTN
MAEHTSFEELRDNRRDYVAAARRNGFEEGLRSLLAELYPDNAHFIYELLQNAEDARATVVEFELTNGGLTVSHDGAREFSLADIESITGIGKSTKKDDETQIGKFGVGFKAVFAYTTRPEIHSGEHSFAISDLFVPELTDGTAPAGRTTFNFPFDRAEKPAEVARAEVERGLRELDEKTLLFLNSIREITYELPDGDIGFVKRTEVDDVTIKVEASQDEGFVESNWLRLVGPASTVHDGHNPLTVAAAFKLEQKETGRGRSSNRPAGPADHQLGIVPLDAGDVSIYFPAAKETSRLRFHIHAPFASTVARDSVRDTPDNVQLVADIGDLIVAHLGEFRDRGLIDDGLLAALPNTEDALAPIYGQIRSALVEAFNNDDLTPVRGGGAFRPARSLVRSPSEFRTGLDEGDLSFLLDLTYDSVPGEPRWILDRDGRPGRFLRDLDAMTFGWEELSSALAQVTESEWSEDPDPEVAAAWLAWLAAKSDDKLLNLYELLGHEDEDYYPELEEIPLIRLRQRGVITHVKGSQTHLPATRSDKAQTRVPVELAYFEDDEDTKRSNNLRSFYRAAGVARWDERARIERRLAAYRSQEFPEDEHDAVPPKHLEDMRAFVKFGLADPAAARSMFNNVHFILVAGDDGNLLWGQPSDVFVDEPFRSTGLSALYADDAHKYPLPGLYLAIEGIDDFLVAVGAAATVTVTPTSTLWLNPKYDRAWAAGKNENYNTVRKDWDIAKFDEIVETADPVLLKSVWEAICSAPAANAVAVYRANASYSSHRFDSLARQRLTGTAWIPTATGLVLPQNLTLEDLPAGWRQPPAGSLASVLPFGADAAKRREEEEFKPFAAKQLGIDLEDVELLKEARAVGVSTDEIRELIALRRTYAAFPDAASDDPDRRSSVAAADATSAASHETDLRLRSVVTGQTQAAEEARSYLREQYTNDGGDMFCQACQQLMPFKVKGQWYFQAIQFVGGRKRVHRQNAVALCPLCAALYRHKRETSDDALMTELGAIDVEPGEGTVDLPVLLNGHVRRLRFTGKHAIDLQTVLDVAGDARV